MNDPLTLFILIAGFTLFATGDAIWLLRHMRNRRMDIRVTGVLIGGGVLLLGVGLARMAFAA